MWQSLLICFPHNSRNVHDLSSTDEHLDFKELIILLFPMFIGGNLLGYEFLKYDMGELSDILHIQTFSYI